MYLSFFRIRNNQSDLLDYAVEIEWFDLHLKRMLDYLEEKGELDNTIVIVTADNGMPFPRAKANCYEYGIHVPFAVRYPKEYPGGRIVDDPVSFADLAPTILEITGTGSEGMCLSWAGAFLNLLSRVKQGLLILTGNMFLPARKTLLLQVNEHGISAKGNT